MDIIQVQNVKKYFGDYAASNDISFRVEKGAIYGLLGPNGAGKTTMIRMITNIYVPDEGKILIKEKEISPEHRDIIGYLPEERGLYKKIKVMDQLLYFAQLKGMNRTDATKKAQEWLIRLGAADWAGKKIQELSKGMQQKVQFISTILHDPEILILDEPFSGFDPINADILKNVILEFKEQGKTILLSTHIMEQVEQLCDDICLINKGNAVLEGNVREIKKSYGRDTILLEFEGDDSFLDEIDGLHFINRAENRVEFRLTNSDIKAEEFLKTIVDKTDIYRFELAEPSLHEIFVDVVSKDGAK